MIEDALGASAGRVFGPSGAAARLGVPGSTLESRTQLRQSFNLSVDPHLARLSPPSFSCPSLESGRPHSLPRLRLDRIRDSEDVTTEAFGHMSSSDEATNTDAGTRV